MNTYVVAVNLENLDSGLVTLHQASFNSENRYEAIGRAVDKFISEDVAIHSYRVSTGNEEISEYIDLLEQGRKIEAIKLRRQHTGDGLKESKEFIDDLVREFNIKPTINPARW